MKNNFRPLVFISTVVFLCCVGFTPAWSADNASVDKAETPVALRFLEREAEDNDAGAQLLYGMAYLNGRDGLKLDAEKAVYWLRRSARMGNAYAQLMLGKAYAEGNGVAKDLSHAVKWWRESAEKDNAEAQFLLGKAFLQGQGIAKDTDKAIVWLEKSAEQNNKDAQFLLGKLRLEGKAVTKDETVAQSWLQRAAALGHQDAIYLLSLMEDSIDFTLKLYQESADALKTRAEDGDAQAEYELGIRYESGAWDVTQDNAKALQWITKSAEAGNTVAMGTLAHIYRHGDLGMPVDIQKAEAWEKKAALVK
jgi:TPR repeat protein